MPSPIALWRPPSGIRIDPTSIDATGATLGHVLTAVSDGSGGQRAAYAVVSTGATNLDGLTDVTITSPAATQVLQYNGSLWVNAAAPSGLPAIPSDWATTEYVLGIVAGVAAWRPATTATFATGFGNNFGNDFGGP